MRYTKGALLVFGAGLLLGLAVATFQLTPLERVASGVMALGLAAVPIGLVLDWRRAAVTRKPAAKKRRRGPRRAPAGSRRRARPRKPRTPDR
ncbi:MAG TPA: hypothetical protein VGR91_14515 [Stellaceae bacterium]|nr:hypothetical protein [Stellaceae bacterium]